MYNKVTDDVVKKLVAICGEKYVTTSEPLRHSYMARGIMGLEAVLPEAIVRPANADEVSRILVMAKARTFPRLPAATWALSHGRAAPEVPATFARRPPNGRWPRPPPRRTPHPDRSATVPNARLA